jgi:hypothetical protein
MAACIRNELHNNLIFFLKKTCLPDAKACATCALFVWLINHQTAVLFSQNKPATSNQPTVLFSHNKSAPAISHQPNEQAARRRPDGSHGWHHAVARDHTQPVSIDRLQAPG